MNTKTVGILIAVLVLLAGGFMLLGRKPQVPQNEVGQEAATSETVDTTVEETGANEATDVQTFTLDGANFKFSETEIRVKKGTKVKIVLNVKDMMHDWVVDEFNARTEQVAVGKTTSVEFVADKAGTFEYYCSVGNHRAKGMVGKLIVE